MNITVILCTFNRCHSLSKALGSLAATQLQDSLQWEVLVVDNNSNEGTREVALDFGNRFPDRFRYEFEARPGKSYALNTGIKNAHGQILAFTDDDVVVEPDWLQNLTASLHGDEWAGAAGRTLPEREF